MTAPLISSITFDKSSYTHGQTISSTVTVVTTNTFSPFSLTATATDQLTNESSTASSVNLGQVFNVLGTNAEPGTTTNPVIASVTDTRSSSDTWSLQSEVESGSANNTTWTFVFTSIA